MKCPKCQRENEAAARFCIFCGSLLPTAVPGGSSGAVSAEPSQTLAAEVRRLSEVVDLMSNRLAALERAQGTAAAQPAPVAEKAAAPAAGDTRIKPAVEQWQGAADGASPGEARAAKTDATEWEQIIGGNWLAKIGALALVIGVGFFLKFAFDNNWIGPTGRIVLGIIGGLILLLGGHYWMKKYPTLCPVPQRGRHRHPVSFCIRCLRRLRTALILCHVRISGAGQCSLCSSVASL